ncbi:MAG: 3-deoxy-manno-octulosonate cytidylyltransferase [Deltaproteobacteria bacterium]|nr:3-deoxy-manno-octulosonate cytidylyltransferase [Deltaproteobacteria bacterium]
MRVIAFIPSRYDSSRFPGKPMALIAGMPMIGHVCRRAMSCPEVSEVFVVTDDERIFQCVEELGGKAIMTEKRHRTGTDRIAEASQKMSLREDDLIVNIQGDQPLFHPSAISDMIVPMKQDPTIPMSTLKYKIRDETDIDNPNHVKVVTDSEGFALYFSRSPIPFIRDPESKVTYYKHLGFYAYRNDFLLEFATLPVGELESSEKLEQLRVLECGFKIKVVETAFDSVEVDTPADIMKAEAMISESGQSYE